MDRDSKLIFETYVNSKVINEGWIRNLFSGGKAPLRYLTTGSLKEVEDLTLQTDKIITKVLATPLKDPSVLGAINRGLSDDINAMIERLAQRYQNNPNAIAFIKTIAAQYNETMTRFLKVGEKFDSKNLNDLVDETNTSFEDLKELFSQVGGQISISDAKTALKAIESLQESLKAARDLAEKTLKENSPNKLKMIGKLLTTYPRASMLTALSLIGGLEAAGVSAGQTLGKGAVYTVSTVASWIWEALKGIGSGAWEGGKEIVTGDKSKETPTASPSPSPSPEPEETPSQTTNSIGFKPFDPNQP